MCHAEQLSAVAEVSLAVYDQLRVRSAPQVPRGLPCARWLLLNGSAHVARTCHHMIAGFQTKLALTLLHPSSVRLSWLCPAAPTVLDHVLANFGTAVSDPAGGQLLTPGAPAACLPVQHYWAPAMHGLQHHGPLKEFHGLTDCTCEHE